MTKSLFLYVNRGPIWYGFCAGAIPICPRVNIAQLWGPGWCLLVAPSSVNHCLIFFFSFFNSAMKVDPLQEIEWLPEKSWDRNLIFFTMARKVNLLKLLLRKRKRKQIMQEKGDYARKLLLLACRMWKMDQQIHVMFKNQSKDIIAFVNDPWTFSITTASLPNWISQGVTDANLMPLSPWLQQPYSQVLSSSWVEGRRTFRIRFISCEPSCTNLNMITALQGWHHVVLSTGLATVLHHMQDKYFRNVDHCEDD